MLKDWQFNVLFFVGVGGAVLLLLGPEFGLNFSQSPTALAGVGSILTYILTQKKISSRRSNDEHRYRRGRRIPSADDESENSEERHEEEDNR